jgi:hypothetical protein
VAAGRPTKYKPEYCQQLIEHMSQGLSFETFAAVIDVNDDTLYEWAKVHPEFSDAKKRAFGKCKILWEKMGIAGATGKIRNFNAAAWIFNMKNRFGWKTVETPEFDGQPKSIVIGYRLEDLKTKIDDSKARSANGENIPKAREEIVTQ